MDWQYSTVYVLYRCIMILEREDEGGGIIQCSNTEPHYTVKLLLFFPVH